MAKATVSEDDITRLEEERRLADRAYNEALTAVDRAAARAPFQPAPHPGPDDTRLAELNAAWEVIGPAPVATGGWRGRVAGIVWRILAPVLQRQQAFNSAVVDHLNRAQASDSASRDSIAALAGDIAADFGALSRLHSDLIRYLQQITLYVDTKDRHEAAVLRHLVEHRTEGLAAGLDALGDELLKRWEAALARERRFDAKVEEIGRRLSEDREPPRGAGAETADRRLPRLAPVPIETVRRDALAEGGSAGTYAGFEDSFRGREEEIETRQSDYLPLFAGARDVLDIGCGRGEFLRLLAENDIAARGVEVNPEMVRRCRELGLEVVEAEGLAYLETLPDESLGGVFAAQVVEHLQPDRILHLVALSRRKLRPGGRIVLETINPACWAAFFSSYIRDLTHVRPIHPETLSYLLTAGGFENVDIRYSSPYPAEARLQRLPLTLLSEGEAVTEIVEQFNRNVDTLNKLMFTHLDYAAVGEKPARAEPA